MNNAPNSRHLIRWSLFWGGVFTLLFYGAIYSEWITHPMVLQYCTNHPIEYVIVGMFLVGFAFVAVKYVDLLGQGAVLSKGAILPERGLEPVPVTTCEAYREVIAEHIRKNGDTIYARRLNALLHYLQGGDPEMLDVEMRYRSDDDVASTDDEYAFVRTILWAVPMLGFLGTVVGITMALSNLDLNAITESSKALSDGLSVAFDTTALGIGLDLFLYFCQFLTHRREMQILKAVDHLVERELRGRFEMEQGIASGSRGEVAAVRKMLNRVAETLEALIQSQAEIWNQAITAVNGRYAKIATEAASTIQGSLGAAMNENIARHAEEFGRIEQRLHEALREDANRYHDHLRGSTEMMQQLTETVTRQTEASRRVVEATGQIAALENQLNANLRAVAGVGNFEETINSLAAAIHLLNTRMHAPTPGSVSLRSLSESGDKGYAA